MLWKLFKYLKDSKSTYFQRNTSNITGNNKKYLIWIGLSYFRYFLKEAGTNRSLNYHAVRWKNRRSQVFSSARFERKFCGSVLLKKENKLINLLTFCSGKIKSTPIFSGALFPFKSNQTPTPIHLETPKSIRFVLVMKILERVSGISLCLV